MRSTALGLLVLCCCTSGTQRLWIASETPELLTVSINGERQELELHGLQAFSRLGAER